MRMRLRRRYLLLAGLPVLILTIGVAAWSRTGNAPLLRTIALPRRPFELAVDARTHRVFVIGTTVGGYLSMLDARTGTLLRTVALGALPLHLGGARLAVDTRTGRVFIPNGGGITMLDARTGAPLRTIAAGGYATKVDELRGHVFSLSSHALAMLDARSGALLRVTPLPIVPVGLAVVEPSGWVVASDQSGARVSLLDARSGELVRTIAGAGDPVAIDGRRGRVFGITATGVSLLDVRSGRLVRTLPVDDSYDAAVDLRQGLVIVPTATSFSGWRAPSVVTLRRTLDGMALRTMRVGTGRAVVALDARSDQLVVATTGPFDASGNAIARGTVRLIDARSGQVRRTVTVGVDPLAVAVDERTERTFVVNSGGIAPPPDPWTWIPAPVRRRLPFLAARPQAHPVSGSVNVLALSR